MPFYGKTCIIIGHEILGQASQVDQAKVYVLTKLPLLFPWDVFDVSLCMMVFIDIL